MSLARCHFNPLPAPPRPVKKTSVRHHVRPKYVQVQRAFKLMCNGETNWQGTLPRNRNISDLLPVLFFLSAERRKSFLYFFHRAAGLLTSFCLLWRASISPQQASHYLPLPREKPGKGFFLFSLSFHLFVDGAFENRPSEPTRETRLLAK